MSEFLDSIGKPELSDELLDFSSWTKIIPLPKEQKEKKSPLRNLKNKNGLKTGCLEIW